MRSSGKLSYVENQFSADVSSVDHLMRAGGVPQRKHIDRRYVDQSTVNQIGDFPHRLSSSLKVNQRNDLAKASPLGFHPIAFGIAICGHCEDFDLVYRLSMRRRFRHLFPVGGHGPTPYFCLGG